MASNLTWTVSMGDRVSAVATKIGSNLNALNAKFKTLGATSAKPLGARLTAPGKTGANMAGGLFGQPKTNWVSDLIAKLSGISPAAGRAGAGLIGMVARAQAAFRGLGPAAQSAVTGAGSALRGLGSAIGSVVAMAAQAALVLGAMGVAAGVAGAKWIAQMQALKQSTVFAFASTMGGQTRAIAGFERMAETAVKIGAPLDDVAKAMTGLMAQGFSFDAADQLVKRMADLKAINPSANIEKIALAISQIKAKGKLSQEELSGQLAETGLSPDMVYTALAKKLGKDKASIIKMISAGQIDSKTGIEAIEEAMKEQTGGGAAGDMAEKLASTTLLGGIGRLQARIQKFATGLQIDFAPVARFLGKIGEALEGESGKEFGAAIEALFASLGSALDSIGKDDVKAFFSSLSSVIRGVATSIQFVVNAFAWFDAVGAKIDQVQASMGALGTAASMVGSLIWASLSSVASMLLDAFLGPIGAIGRALWGLLAGIGQLTGIKVPEIPKELVQNAATPGGANKDGSKPPTTEEIVKKVSEAKTASSGTSTGSDGMPTQSQGGAAAPGGKPAGASTTKVDVGVDILFNTEMFTSRVREIVKTEMGAAADAP